MSRPTFDLQTIAAAQRLRAKGLPYWEIAREMGFSTSEAYYSVNPVGVEPSEPDWARGWHREADELHRTGYSIREVARALGRSYSAVWKVLRGGAAA